MAKKNKVFSKTKCESKSKTSWILLGMAEKFSSITISWENNQLKEEKVSLNIK